MIVVAISFIHSHTFNMGVFNVGRCNKKLIIDGRTIMIEKVKNMKTESFFL